MPSVFHLSPSVTLCFFAGNYQALNILGRCFRFVDSSSDGYPKFVPIDEEAQHQIVHR